MTCRRLLVPLVAVACLVLSGCGVVFLGVIGEGPDPSVDRGDSDWVVVTYSVAAGSSDDVMEKLLDTAEAADRTLQNAGAGSFDSDKVGVDECQLYFVGQDRRQMWRVLESVFVDAPFRWSRVELYRALGEDPDEVIRRR